MPIFNFYHPEDERLIAKIKAIDAEEAEARFIGSYNSGYFVNPKFAGRESDEELQYLHFDWDIVEEGLSNGQFDWEPEEKSK